MTTKRTFWRFTLSRHQDRRPRYQRVVIKTERTPAGFSAIIVEGASNGTTVSYYICIRTRARWKSLDRSRWRAVSAINSSAATVVFQSISAVTLRHSAVRSVVNRSDAATSWRLICVHTTVKWSRTSVHGAAAASIGSRSWMNTCARSTPTARCSAVSTVARSTTSWQASRTTSVGGDAGPVAGRRRPRSYTSVHTATECSPPWATCLRTFVRTPATGRTAATSAGDGSRGRTCWARTWRPTPAWSRTSARSAERRSSVRGTAWCTCGRTPARNRTSAISAARCSCCPAASWSTWDPTPASNHTSVMSVNASSTDLVIWWLICAPTPATTPSDQPAVYTLLILGAKQLVVKPLTPICNMGTAIKHPVLSRHL